MIAKIQTNTRKIVKSQSYDITYGTAPGSCLGPLLFSIFINDIYPLPTFGSIVLFADDTSLFNSIKNLQFLKYSMEHDMTLLSNWYKVNQLLLNINKMMFVKFWPDKPFELKVGDTTIKNSMSTKFLGMIVDKCLGWKAHCDYLYSKINANRCLIMKAKNLLPLVCLRNIYMAHIYSHLLYGITVWGPMSPKSSQNSLYRLQKNCIRHMHKKHLRYNTDELFKKSKIIRFPDLVK